MVLDYPRERFTIAPSGCVKHRGVKVPSLFLPASGHPRIDVSVAARATVFFSIQGLASRLHVELCSKASQRPIPRGLIRPERGNG